MHGEASWNQSVLRPQTGPTATRGQLPSPWPSTPWPPRQAFDRDVVSHSLGIEQYAVKVGQSGNSSSEANIGNHLPDQAGKQWLVIFGDALCIGQENDRAWVCHRPVFPFGHRS